VCFPIKNVKKDLAKKKKKKMMRYLHRLSQSFYTIYIVLLLLPCIVVATYTHRHISGSNSKSKSEWTFGSQAASSGVLPVSHWRSSAHVHSASIGRVREFSQSNQHTYTHLDTTTTTSTSNSTADSHSDSDGEFEYRHNLAPVPNNMSKCGPDLFDLVFGFEPWDTPQAALMLAAFGKGYGDLGDYETCDSVGGIARYGWLGQYLNESVGVCIPSTCDEASFEDVLAILVYRIPQLNETGIVFHLVSDDQQLHAGGIIIMTVLGLLVLVVIAATLAEIMRRSHWKLRELYAFGDDDGTDDTQSAISMSNPLLRDEPETPYWISVWSLITNMEDLFSLEAKPPRISSSRNTSDGYAGVDFAASGHASDNGTGYASGHDSPITNGRTHNSSNSNSNTPVLVHDIRVYSLAGKRIGKRGEFDALNGIRALSMLWIILAQSYRYAGPLFKNPAYIEQVVERFSFQVVISATLATDSFLVVSGFLSALSILRLLERRGRLAIVSVYMRRLMRFVPAMAITTVVYWSVTPYIANGPVWYMYSDVCHTNCESRWYRTALMVSNLANSFTDACMQWSWFGSLSVQLYIFFVPILWLLYKHHRTGMTVLILSLIGSIASNMAVASQEKLSPNMVYITDGRYQDKILTKPWARADSFVIGIFAYIAYSYIRSKPRRLRERVFSPVVQVLGMALSCLLLFLCIFGPYRDYEHGVTQWSHTANVLYIGLARPAFAASVAIIMTLTFAGQGSIVGVLLSARFWRPFAKLTYCLYLVHPTVILMVYYNSGALVYYRDVTIVYFFVTNAFLSSVAAVMLYVLVERPLRTIAAKVFD
jgi:peptidoglycan/LPS O-acetylase OafA/YrhL